MAGRDLRVLHLERNVARTPAFGPRAGIPLKSALAWPPVPLNRQPFLITHLEGALGPGDLVVFANLCDRYWRDRAGGGRVVVSLNEVARWLGQERPGGSQRRQAVGSLVRLRAATFTSVLRAKGRDTERLVRGWGLWTSGYSRNTGRSAAPSASARPWWRCSTPAASCSSTGRP